MYALNNPLRFIDPSGYTRMPAPYGDEYNVDGFSNGYNRTPFANAFVWGRTVGGYSYNWATGKYDNSYSGSSMSAYDFSNAILPAYQHPDHTAYGASAANALSSMHGYNTQMLGKPDALGSQFYLRTDPSGAMTTFVSPFWKETGSYYNELYYFSGLVAFDTYQAKRELVASGASVDFTLALGPIGFSIEAGSIDYNEGVHRFFSIGSAIGLEASLSMNKINIREYPQNYFTPQNYAGWSTTTNHSLTYFTYGLESALQYTQSPYYKYGYNANQFSFGLGALPVAWSEVRAYTWVGKRQERYQINGEGYYYNYELASKYGKLTNPQLTTGKY